MASRGVSSTISKIVSTGIPQNVESALLNQMKNEFRVSRFYLSASYFFTNRHYHGISSFLKTEHQKETEHAFSISDYMTKRGTDLTLRIIDLQSDLSVDTSIKDEVLKWNEPIDIFTFLYAAEQQNQIDINDVMTLAQEENDHATYEFLLEFMKQQIDCTHESEDILAQVTAYSKFDGLLWHLDAKLG